MASLTTQIPAISFASQLDHLEFQCDAKSLKLQINVGGVAVLDTGLDADDAHQVHLFCLAQLLNSYLKGAAADVAIKVDGAVTTTRCLPSAASLDIAAENFVDSRFLTRCDGARPAFRNTHEVLTFYNRGKETVRDLEVNAVFKTPSGFVTKYTSIDLPSVPDNYTTFRLAVADVENLCPDGRLISFRLDVDDRKQEYVMQMEERVESLGFRNAFGAMESVDFTYVAVKHSPKLTAADINGVRRTLKVEREKEFTAEVDFLSDAFVPVMEDLTSSVEVFRGWGDRAVPLVVKSGEVETDSSIGGHASAKVVLKEAAALPHSDFAREVRVFNVTFDNTFA